MRHTSLQASKCVAIGLICIFWLFLSGFGQQAQPKTPLKPRPGFDGVLSAFQQASIVALPDRHRDSNSSQFRIDLIAQTKFAATVNDIVIEWANRLYQDTLDRYVAGEDVPKEELQKLWRNTTVINGMWDSPVYSQFLLAVRTANKSLPQRRRIRVLAGDPPIDWEKVKNARDFEQFATRRDESELSVIQDEVVAKRHKALLIMGGGHFRRGVKTDGQTCVVDLLETAHPLIRVFVIGVTPSLNQELGGYAPASFFFTRRTWLEELSSARGVIIYDGVLTLPDGEDLRADSVTYNDPTYSKEMDRRWHIVFGRAFDPSQLP